MKWILPSFLGEWIYFYILVCTCVSMHVCMVWVLLGCSINSSLSESQMHLCVSWCVQALLPTYNILDGAQALLEAHKIGNRLVGGLGVKAFLPRKWVIMTALLYLDASNAC